MSLLFDHKSYKKYLLSALGGAAKRTGQRAKAAAAMNCQLAYLSRVLNGDADLSLEQAIRLSEYLEHTSDEKKYFLLLLQKDRSGTKELEKYFRDQLQEITALRQQIKGRVNIKEELSQNDQSRYYSRWYYSCIHVMISIPALTTKESIAEYLDLPMALVTEAIEFLALCGLIEDHKGKLSISKRHIHLGHNSENIEKHHMNWRTRAMLSLDRVRPGDLHYSVVFTLSREDSLKLRERLLQTIQENLKDVAPSKEEVVYCQSIDFFELGRK